MAELLIAGDWHLGRLQRLFPQQDWPAWSLAPLRQIEHYALEHGIKYVVQLGDVFDEANPSQYLLRLLAEYLLSSKVHWAFSIGNHDISHRDQHSLMLLDFLSQRNQLGNCRFFPDETRHKIAGVPTIFLPWPKRKSELLNGRPSLVIAHTERRGARYDNGRQITAHDFKLGKHFWCIGDLHEFQTFEQLIYPGALAQLRFGDSEAKYFLHLRVKPHEDRISVRYKRIRLTPQYILRDLSVNDLPDLAVLDQADANIFFRLLIQQDVAVPDKYLQHPQVIKHRYFGDRRDLRAIQQDSFNLTTEFSDNFSRLRVLNQWLRQETQLPKRRIKYALRYARQLEGQLFHGQDSAVANSG